MTTNDEYPGYGAQSVPGQSDQPSQPSQPGRPVQPGEVRDEQEAPEAAQAPDPGDTTPLPAEQREAPASAETSRFAPPAPEDGRVAPPASTPYGTAPQAPAGYSVPSSYSALGSPGAPGEAAEPPAAHTSPAAYVAPGSAPQPPAAYSAPSSYSALGAPGAPGEAGEALAAYSAPAAGPQDAGSRPAPVAAAGVPPYVHASSEPSASPRRRRRGPGWGGVAAISLTTALLASGGAVAATQLLNDEPSPAASTPAPTSIATGPTTQTVTSTGTTPDWEAVTAAVSNAVVSITVATAAGTGVGSGVIYDSSGHIITNNHVVAGATQIQVSLADGRIYDAELTGTDPATDLAVIELVDAPDDLTVARFEDSDSLVTGQDVLAIGNPLGLSSTATTGIISALNRPVVTTQEQQSEENSSDLPDSLGGLLGDGQSTTTEVYTNAIQIDAAVNPGNSGGPLFDETGAVIGITSSIASTSETSGSIGIGFAIPANLATKVADQLIETSAATHAFLGVGTQNGGATADGVTRAGAEVSTVEEGSPAQDAGIQEGDVIIAVDGKATNQSAALIGFVRQYSAGDEVTLTIIRDGQEMEVPVTLSERSDQ
ncbi:MAG: trypsin-like peptidase domain-containing protein [Actinomyces sp.]|uniref:trypsin-like peptidase domain-containing protein n=1 Tax=Actinomyces sp. TaxID=29317 RepID=UPI0026DCEA93|nr:trypsin-like peptidase domain-containing protein [Actinomyces sp.]MDO4242165.1 trypsin-like peptidase domain-containing protein [Actinomyces sp.]